jgi:hypothetical protein
MMTGPMQIISSLHDKNQIYDPTYFGADTWPQKVKVVTQSSNSCAHNRLVREPDGLKYGVHRTTEWLFVVGYKGYDERYWRSSLQSLVNANHPPIIRVEEKGVVSYQSGEHLGVHLDNYALRCVREAVHTPNQYADAEFEVTPFSDHFVYSPYAIYWGKGSIPKPNEPVYLLSRYWHDSAVPSTVMRIPYVPFSSRWKVVGGQDKKTETHAFCVQMPMQEAIPILLNGLGADLSGMHHVDPYLSASIPVSTGKTKSKEWPMDLITLV